MQTLTIYSFSPLVTPTSSPHYYVDTDNCLYKSYTYDHKAKEHVFTTQLGSHFHLKLEISGNPSGSKKCTLQKLGPDKLQGVAKASLKYDVDLVDILIISKQHEDSYVIKAFSSDGEATLQFRIIVEGIIIIHVAGNLVGIVLVAYIGTIYRSVHSWVSTYACTQALHFMGSMYSSSFYSNVCNLYPM
jgi:hypothetical protein